MNQAKSNSQPRLSQNCSGSVPESVMSASRFELTDTNLEIVAGEIPQDIHGHVFIVAPVGSIDSGGIPYPDGSPIFNGDGMIYRLDFDTAGQVKVRSRLTKPPCFYADRATREGSKYQQYRFRTLGMGRFSFQLGLRNQLNVAFLPMKFAPDENDRLLIACDAGRPYEIDTETLEVVTPVGTNQEWRSLIPFNFPFRPFLSNAHCTFDAHTKEVFTANYGRSLGNLLETIPFIYELGEIPEEFDELLERIAEFALLLQARYTSLFLGAFSQLLANLLEDIFQFSENLLESILGSSIDNFVYLIRWDGTSNLERWKVMFWDEKGDKKPVAIEQTMHQLAVTKDYVVLMETGFKFRLEQIINNPFPQRKGFEELLKALISGPQSPNTNMYIIRRQDLKAGQQPACSQQEVEVIARKVVVPLETIHFLADYENRDDRINLYLGHNCAWDGGEWIRQYDKAARDSKTPVPPRLYGMISQEMDIGRIGRYTINGETGEVITSQVISDAEATWGVGFYTYRERLASGMPPQYLEDIYWTSFGLWQELMTKSSFDLYDTYKYRAVPPAELIKLAERGIPNYLFRLKITDRSIEIADRYQFPKGYIVNSIQFVPRRDGSYSSTDGYIVCVVYYDNKNEVWIFDASNLDNANPPLCKLSSPDFDFGFTIHNTWLPQISPRQADYFIPVRQDYEEIVKKQPELIQELFLNEIYPHFSDS